MSNGFGKHSLPVPATGYMALDILPSNKAMVFQVGGQLKTSFTFASEKDMQKCRRVIISLMEMVAEGAEDE